MCLIQTSVLAVVSAGTVGWGWPVGLDDGLLLRTSQKECPRCVHEMAGTRKKSTFQRGPKTIHPRKWAAASPNLFLTLFRNSENHLSTIHLHDFLGFDMWIFQDVCAATYRVLWGFEVCFRGHTDFESLSKSCYLEDDSSALDPVVRIILIYKPWSRGSDSSIGDYDCHAY